VRRSLEPLLAQGVEVKIPVLPSPEDPDSFTRKFGGDKVRELFGQSEDIVAFLLRSAAKPVDAMSPEEKDGLLQDCLGLLQTMPSAIVREQYVDELRKKLGLKAIRVQVAKPATRYAQQAQAPLAKAADGGAEGADLVAVFSGAVAGGRPREEALAEWQLLQALISSPALARSALDAVKLEWFQLDPVRDLVDHLLAFVEEQGAFSLKDFLARLPQEQQDAVTGLRLAEGMDAEQEQKHFQGLLRALELRWLMRRRSQETDKIRFMDFQKRIRELQTKGKGGTQ
jgi:DNA primase